MSTPDNNTLRDAREWAEPVDPRMVSQGMGAAAEVIRSLPDSIVDGDKLREVIEDIRGALGGPGCEALEALIPSPPTMADVKWDDAVHHLAEAVTPSGNRKVMLASAGIDHLIYCVDSDGDVNAWEPNQLTPTGKRYKLTPNNVETEGEFRPKVDETIEQQPAPWSNPENVPAGEAWLVEYDGSECYGIRDWEGAPNWTVIDPSGDREPAEDVEVRKIARLVPEREYRELVTEQDYKDAVAGTVVKSGTAVWEKFPIGDWVAYGMETNTSPMMADIAREVLWEPDGEA